MRAAISVEWWKVRRSPVTLVATILMALLLPAMGIGFYQAAVNGGNGALADKAAALVSGTGWSGYLGLVGQIAAVALFLGVGVVVAWVFGREHVDRTFPSLFARPVSVTAIAAAKYLVTTIWMLLLVVVVVLLAVLLGAIAGIGAWTVDAVPALTRLLAVSTAAGTLGLTTGYVASVGRGYLPAIGSVIVVIAVAQVAVLIGTGAWFPFAVPGLMAIAGGEGAPDLSAAQIALVPVLAAVGVGLTLRWWQKAEVA